MKSLASLTLWHFCSLAVLVPAASAEILYAVERLVQICPLGVTMSWEEGHPGARASRPHHARQSPGNLPDPDQPATAPRSSLCPADAVASGRMAASGFGLKLSGGQ